LGADHKNEERFLGLSVKEEGYIAFGSEDGNAVIYHNACSSPVAKFAFEQGALLRFFLTLIPSLLFLLGDQVSEQVLLQVFEFKK